MDRETARSLIPMVNNLDFYADLELYVNYRIAEHRKDLENAELSRVQTIQGQIKELRMLKDLRTIVLTKAQ